MKKIIQIYAAFIIFAFAITLNSCSDSPVDKKIDEIEAFVTRMDKLVQEENPSREEIVNFKNDSKVLLDPMSNYGLNDYKLTPDQKKRMLGIFLKMQNIHHDPNFQRLQKFAKMYQTGSSNDDIASQNEEIENSWRNLEANYQRRTDLYNSVIKSVRGSASADSLKSTLEQVLEASTQATSVKVDINNSETVLDFQRAQTNLQNTFANLQTAIEPFPDLKMTTAFQYFQAQIEGLENRINVAKNEYNELCKKNGRTDILLYAK